MSYYNVISFGAGDSFDAGIPLIRNFIDTMWGYSDRGKSPQGTLSQEDKNLFAEAVEIRNGLERYNSRANFNIRNLEDVLSILSFEALEGGENRKKYDAWVRAISRTIELSTSHQFRESAVSAFEGRNTVYHQFWNSVLGGGWKHWPPALITFNYDLVLERTLWGYFHYLDENPIKPARRSCKINYFLKPYNFVVGSELHNYHIPRKTPKDGQSVTFREPDIELYTPTQPGIGHRGSVP